MDPRAFMSSGGEMGVLIRAHDWASSPLGEPESWPQGLRTALRTALTTRHPMFVFWGPQHLCFYNDGYRRSLGPEKHPSILGAPGRAAFTELWDIIAPQIDLVMHGDGATWHENQLVPSFRHGRLDEVYWTYSYGPIDDETMPNGVGGVLVVCTETTAQVKQEAALRESQQALQRLNDQLEERVAAALAERRVLADIVEGTDALVQVADLGFRWIAINNAAASEFERIFGVRPQVGQNMLDALDAVPEQREAVRSAWQRALDGETFSDLQPLGEPAHGRRYYEMRFSPLLDAEGRRIGAYQFVYDVTERLQEQARLAEAEDTLRQTQKIETLGQLTGGVAHDFNNLLTPVMGALDFARLELKHDRTAQELIAVGLQAAERARKLVQRLLAFSRRQQLTPRDVDVPALIDSVAEMALRSLKPGIELVLDVAENLPRAHVDPDQLVLALLNLAVNARDAVEGQGTLTVRACAVDAQEGEGLSAGRYVRVEVEDTGIGMDEATLQRATEPFFTTKEPGRGTGLGLSSVLGVAVQSGGGFRLRSRPGAGTTASLWLPVALHPASAPGLLQPDVASDADAGADRTVLLVDDDDLVRASAASTLRQAGYRVLEASSATAALRALQDEPGIQLLVTDYAMPVMTGIELARQVRDSRPALPVLLITGYADLDESQTAAVERLFKPFRPDELRAAVAALLRSQRAESDVGTEA